MTRADEQTEHLRAALPGVLAPTLGAVEVNDLRALSGGASRSTWAFDAVGADGRRALILRSGAGDDLHASMELEAAVQTAAAAAGAPVPQILAADNSPTALGEPYLICAAVPGETIVRRIFRQLDAAPQQGGTGRQRLLRQCAEALAAIHRADTAALGDQAPDPLALWRAELDAVTRPDEATAPFEWVFRWLATHRPPDGPARLVHGDFRMGNLIVDGAQLTAVLDWELVHLGQPAADLAWFCIRAWRFGAPAHQGAGGLGSIEEFLTAYEAAGGAPVDRTAFHWWLVLATLRWGIICRYQAHRHLSGRARSVELATIGRRVAETEWDLLTLLQEAHR
ncbi:phosphotransferase family protein [Mycolicibacillus parakoreensis]|uniref:Phosphotransferase family protein n=1 Tax=Mycolicibacillus parakoreensis TaxID=1069221 RepID=A0ABY3U149_9MYCO|nr:phosphotransferase family protein [Mycolicibacillus parakoreensis]ULN51866.1 phosphotransferase family protein [Mycolicibacillus parakoreensis]